MCLLLHGPFILSPFVLAELDYSMLTRLGLHIEDKVLNEVVRDKNFCTSSLNLVKHVVADLVVSSMMRAVACNRAPCF